MSNIIINPNNRMLQLAQTGGYRLPSSWVAQHKSTIDIVYPSLAMLLSGAFVFLSQLTGGVVAVGIIVAVAAAQGATLPNFDGPPEQVQREIAALITPDTGWEMMVILVGAFGPIFLILALWLWAFEKRGLWTIGLERQQALWRYLRGVLVGLAMFAASVGILAALGLVDFETGDPRTQGLAALTGVGIVLLGWLVQGAAEEALTRGWLLPLISSRYNIFWGILLSSSLFAFLHLLNPNVSPIAVVNLFLFGVFAALYTLWEGGLWGIFAIHSIWNWAQGNLFGFEVSGNPQAGGTLLNLMEVGPDYLTGGEFGPEGGLVVTVVLVVSCALVWWAGRGVAVDLKG